MSYPEAHYSGHKGEISAVYRPTDTAPDLAMSMGTAERHYKGTEVHYLATGASTKGQFGLYRWDMGTQPSGPSAHFHVRTRFVTAPTMIRIVSGLEAGGLLIAHYTMITLWYHGGCGT